jgi:hypothetical protein
MLFVFAKWLFKITNLYVQKSTSQLLKRAKEQEDRPQVKKNTSSYNQHNQPKFPLCLSKNPQWIHCDDKKSSYLFPLKQILFG